MTNETTTPTKPHLGWIVRDPSGKLHLMTDLEIDSSDVKYERLHKLYTHTDAQTAPLPEPVNWREHVEQRIRTWRQRTMNTSGDMLAIDDFMGQDSIDDLLNFVCDEWAAPAAQPAPTSKGMVLMPKRMTQAMRDVTDQADWTWEDLLAAAEAITEDEFSEIATPPGAPVQGEFELRGILASKLTCWHRLTETEASELVTLVAGLAKPAPAPLTRKELRSMWIERQTAWDFYVCVDARLFGSASAHQAPESSSVLQATILEQATTDAHVILDGQDQLAYPTKFKS